MSAPVPMEKRDVIEAAKGVVAEFEHRADNWIEHFVSGSVTEMGHKNLELYLMAKEVVRLRRIIGESDKGGVK